MNKLTYAEMAAAFRHHEYPGAVKHLTGYIVFTEESFDKPYSLESRTYRVSSDNKAYQPNMGGYSIYGSAIDGSDSMVRLERYMAAEKGVKSGWKVAYCYLEPETDV